jgi:hypothetical protein
MRIDQEVYMIKGGEKLGCDQKLRCGWVLVFILFRRANT